MTAPSTQRRYARDALDALGRDRVPLDVDPVEPLRGDLSGHVLGDRGRTEADHELASRDELTHGSDVAKGLGAPPRGLASPLARPEHLAGHRRSDERAHLARKEKSDASHGAIFADPGRSYRPKSATPQPRDGKRVPETR